MGSNTNEFTKSTCAPTRKIVLVIASLRGGGAERVMTEIANYFANSSFKVSLVTLDNPLQDEKFTVKESVERKVIFYQSSSGLFGRIFCYIQRLLQLRLYLSHEKPAVVLSFMTPTNIATIIAAMGLRTRCVVAERTNPAKFSYSLNISILRRLLYRFADCVVVQTNGIAEWLSPRTNASLVVIPNAARCPPEGERMEQKKHIVSVGRLSAEKGFDVLIESFAQLDNVDKEWQLHILGDGPDRKSLEALISKHNLSDTAHLHGFVDDPFMFLQSATIAIQPSRFEGFPNALLEAMACGLPVVATNEAGDMLIEDGINGLLVPSEDVDQLTNAITKLIENPKLCSYLGSNALKTRETYSKDRIMGLWRAVLFPAQSNDLKLL